MYLDTKFSNENCVKKSNGNPKICSVNWMGDVGHEDDDGDMRH